MSSFKQMPRAQLEIYARELQVRFLEERRLRKEMSEMSKKLEQRARELAALNQMFQKHLAERYAIVESYRQVLGSLHKLAQDTAILLDRAQSQPLPDLRDFSGAVDSRGDDASEPGQRRNPGAG